jgi:hypothetical protein
VKSKRQAEKDIEGAKRHPAHPTRIIISYDNNMRRKRSYIARQSWRKPEMIHSYLLELRLKAELLQQHLALESELRCDLPGV